MTCLVTIGSPNADHIAIRVLRREHPDATLAVDREWLRCQVDCQFGGFRANVEGWLTAGDFGYFREGVERINETLVGQAQIVALEAWFEVRMTCLPNGSLETKAEVRDPNHFDRALSVEFRDLDQSYLPALLADLRALEAEFPRSVER